jgi:hypothetical protein
MKTYSIAGFTVAAPEGIAGFEPFVAEGGAKGAKDGAEVSADLELRPEGDDDAAVKFSAWLAFARLIVPLGAVPIHASAVVCGGGGVLFLGESGTGKSTHTTLWRKHIDGAWLLNDDSPIVRVTDGKVTAHGSPWSGKTPCYLPASVPLRALVRLRQSPENRIERLTGLRAVAALWPSCPPQLADDPALKNTMLALVGGIVSAVPIYMMDCRPDRQAALIARQAVYGHS